MTKRPQTKTVRGKRSLEAVVGKDTYAVWVNMLGALVPDGRSHRLAPLVAGMLQYAVVAAEEMSGEEVEENSVAESLLRSTEVADPEEVKELLHEVVIQLFADAGANEQRISARGERYSIADGVYCEYVNWFDMPWEA